MAPTVVGTSTLCLCEDKLINSLSNSSAFQAFVGAGDATEALTRIYLNEYPDLDCDNDDEYTEQDWDSLFPSALILEEDGVGPIQYSHTSDGGPYGYLHSVTLHVGLETLRGTGNAENVHRTFKDACLNILQDLLAVSGTVGYFAITEARHSSVSWHQPGVEGGTERMRMVLSLVYEGG